MSALAKFLKKKGDARGVTAGGKKEIADAPMGDGVEGIKAMLSGEEKHGKATGALHSDEPDTVSVEYSKLKKLLHGIGC